ncbi:MAG: nitronate monooxygenase family protein [Candidatus Auribacterota bacterium]|nr:nitronate monooxygenase family protein [Candidatus Auribacterota bacterium]
MSDTLKPLVIGDLEIKVPIIQGGMGVRVSRSSLASAVANCGGAGTIASVGLSVEAEEAGIKDFVEHSNNALKKEIRKARELTQGALGVNIMVALSNYADLVKAAASEPIDFIVSGAGLPLKMPELAAGSSVKLIPIVSSVRVTDLIIKTWKKRYDRTPDAIVVEGPLAGGHLGYRFEDLQEEKTSSLDKLLTDILKIVKQYEKDLNVKIPVIAAGGIFNGKDVARILNLGASGVQIGTRFVATEECSVPDEFKQLYINAGPNDTFIIKSPVGLPGRTIRTKFVEKIMQGVKFPFICKYKCLKTCDPEKAPYCIAKALLNAVKGDIENAIVFAGSTVSRVKKIVSVKELIDEIVTEAGLALHATA